MAEAPFRSITVLHMEQDEPWCNYVLRQFQAGKLNLKVETVNLSRLTMERPPEIEVALKESFVVILLTTAYFMDYMEQNADWFAGMLRNRDPEITTIVCALVHVEEHDFQFTTTSGDYDQGNWVAMEIDVTGKNVKVCISQILGFVDHNALARAKKRGEKTLPKTASSSSMGMSGAVEMIPSTVHEEGEKVALIFPSEISGKVTVYVRNLKKEIPTEALNPYCFVFSAPEMTQEKTLLQINIDGDKYSRLRLCKKVLTVEFNSVDFMLQTHGANSREDLDKKLAQKISDSLCGDGRALMIFDEIMGNSSTESIKQDNSYPSMLHWAAANGLNDLCSALLSASGAHLACNIENRDGHTPADLARKNEFFDLAEFLYDFMETRELAEACESYVKMCKEQQVNQADDELYEVMTPCAANKPPPLPSGRPPLPPLPPRVKLQSDTSPTTDDSSVLPVPGVSKPLPSPQEFLNMKVQPVLAVGAIGSRSQTELIDIQKEVKQGSFSIKEAEMLFSAWKARYETGNAASFKDRQRSLQSLRAEHKKTVEALKQMEKDQKKKKKAKGKSASGEEEGDTVFDLISDPFQSRRPFGSLKSPPPGSGRGSNISDISASSWRSSHDSGRDSAVSQHSSSSEDFELDDEQSVRLRRSGRFKSDSCLEMNAEEGRKSKQEMFMQLTEDAVNLPDCAPPPLPPRHKPSARTKVFSKSSKATPSTLPKKEDKSGLKFLKK